MVIVAAMRMMLITEMTAVSSSAGKTEVDWTFEQISWPCETPTAAKGQGENGKQKLMFLSS